MAELIARNVGPSGIDVAYERFGAPEAPPVLLIMSGQMILWPDGFCAELVDRGLHVIRFDNRDTGRSTHFPDGPEPDIRAAMAGDASSASYTMSDMAADTVGLLDALGLAGAHLVGVSMGGMIAQTVAIEHPTRVRSLTSISSRPGDPDSGMPDFTALAPIGGPPDDRQGVIEWQLRAFRVVGSPGYELDEAAMAERAGRAYDRDHDRVADLRTKVAVVASGDRTERLRGLRVPTLVLHGANDLMCDVSGGRATAAAIPDAKLVIFDGMGHNLPHQLWPEFATHITELVQRAEAATVPG